MNRLFLAYKYREVLFNLSRRNLKVRYKGSFLGFFWSFLNPLLVMAVYTVVFSKIMRVASGDIPYPLFFFTGLVPWIFISSTIAISLSSFHENGSIIKKIFLPLEIIPGSVVFSNLVNMFFSLLVVFAVLAFNGYRPGIFYLLLPGVVIIQFFVALGLALIFSVLNVFFRDLGNMIDAIILSLRGIRE